MKVFLDTEFSSLNEAEAQLISLALVAEDGREFYAEVPPETYRQTCSSFVLEIVLPILWGGQYEMPLSEMARSLRAWLAEFDFVELATDAPARDFRCLRVALDEVGQGWPRNVATGAMLFEPPEAVIAAYFREPGRFQHHALHDARVMRLAWLARRSGQSGPGAT